MKNNIFTKIDQSDLLTDEMKKQYREDREAFLQNKVDEQDETLRNALHSFEVSYQLAL